MRLRLFLPALAALAAALPAEEAEQPLCDKKEEKVQMSFDFTKEPDTDEVKSAGIKTQGVDPKTGKPSSMQASFDFTKDPDTNEVKSMSIKTQRVDPKTGKPTSMQMTFDLPDMEAVQPDPDAARVGMADLRLLMGRIMRYHEGTKAILRALRERKGGVELRQKLLSRQAEFVSLGAQMQRLSFTAEAQGVKFSDESDYAAMMGIYNRLIAEQYVEIDMLKSEVVNMEWDEADKAVPVASFELTVGISDPAVKLADLEKQVPALTQRAYLALADVADMLSLASDAESAGAIVDMLEERAREVEKCRRLIERYLKDVPAEVVQRLQPATAETLRAKIAQVSAPMAKAEFFGCKRLQALFDAYGWLVDTAWSVSIPIATPPHPDKVDMEVNWTSDKERPSSDATMENVTISVQASEKGSAPPPPQEPPAEEKE